MISIADLPHLNAGLNALSAVFLVIGRNYIRKGERRRHAACMLTATGVSATFLISYLIYHFNSGLAKFGGVGVVRPIYFAILIAHVIVAVIITFLVPVTLYRALTGQFDRHRRIAGWTWWLWLYVAVSGIVVYLFAIHLFPYVEGPYSRSAYGLGVGAYA